MTWFCAGCGIEADEHLLTGCDCATGCLFDRESRANVAKGEVCDKHPGRPSRINLDGDNLCQQCADQWVIGEGHAAREREQEALDETTVSMKEGEK